MHFAVQERASVFIQSVSAFTSVDNVQILTIQNYSMEM